MSEFSRVNCCQSSRFALEVITTIWSRLRQTRVTCEHVSKAFAQRARAAGAWQMDSIWSNKHQYCDNRERNTAMLKIVQISESCLCFYPVHSGKRSGGLQNLLGRVQWGGIDT
jgi:hypothetical protein